MPITRRKRASQPEQPENNNLAGTPVEGTTENPDTTQAPSPASPAQPAVPVESFSTDTSASPAPVVSEPASEGSTSVQSASVSLAPISNGDRPERMERVEPQQPQQQYQAQPVPQSYTPTIESGRRTARGELFRRAPQVPPVQQQPAPVQPAPLQPPTHEITLPLGNLLHLSYNPGYTGSDEARSALLHKLANESKAGGRARCWNCGSIAIVYDRWSTRNKTFGDVGIAFCEICGVWSVL